MNRRLRKETIRRWQATLAAGLVVAVVVWALLEWLRRTVKGVEEAVEDVWTAGKRLAQNTQATHLLQTAKRHGARLGEQLAARTEDRG